MAEKIYNFVTFTFMTFALIESSHSALTTIDDFESFTKNVSQTLDDLLSESSYDKRLRPDFGGPPTMVEVNLHIKSMGPVHENEQYYLMDVYFRQSWVDGRLKWEVPGLDEFSMTWLFLEKVWKPDTYFLNGKKSHLHRITSPNKFLRLRRDGFIVYSMRLTIVAKCKMHLRKFPLDTQRCPLVIGSFGYSTEDLVYIWSPKGVTVEENVEMAQYDLGNISTKDNKFVKKGPYEHSVLEAVFVLKRTIGYFVLQIYVPCTLIVSCSWVSFWINPGDAPARVSLAVTTVLSITTLGFGGRAQLPQVSHATALDWWVIFCFAFVFSVMIEYAIINFTDKMRNDLRKMIEARVKAAAEKKAEKERKEQEKVSKVEDDKTKLIPAIQIECFDDPITTADEGNMIHEETQLMENMSDSKYMTEPSRKKTLPVQHLDIEMPSGPMSKFSPKRWRSVPNVLAPEHLGGKMSEDWLKDIEGRRRPPESLGAKLKRWILWPIVYWQSIHFLPREEDIKEPDEEKRFTKIDIMARRIFPLSFSTFALSYTLLYAYYIVDDTLNQDEDI